MKSKKVTTLSVMMQFIKPQGMGNQQDSAITPTAVDR
jgi:hypothetical protein